MTREGYEQALAEVTEAARIYHCGVADDVAGATTGTIWSPICADLLAELAARLRAAGDRYDRAADDRGVRPAERFDCRRYLAVE